MFVLERSLYDSYRLGLEDGELIPKPARKPANEEVAKVPKMKKGVEDPKRQFNKGSGGQFDSKKLAALSDIND